MRYIKIVTFFLLLIVLQQKLVAQTIPVGIAALEDYYRRAQLTGEADSSVSFMIRPIWPKLAFKAKGVFFQDSTEAKSNLLKINSAYRSKDGKLNVSVLPVNLQTQFNSHHPYGWNDGAMIPAKGLQTLFSPGVFIEYGMLTVQLRPEFVFAANTEFDTFDKDHYDITTARYYDFYNNIDLPARFGTKSYARVYLGQSSIRLNYKAVSVGVSTENLWWGPGMRNSLLMSNNAPGFEHITLNTRKPIRTAIGSFEGQLIAGRLDDSGFGVLEPERTYFNDPLYVPKLDDWRYISGLTLTWQPKWVPGLFLGLTRSSQLYNKDLSGLDDYLPFFNSTTKVNGDEAIDDKKDTRGSVFMRWLWPEEQAEIYFEYGHNNNTGTLRNQALDPSRRRAYTFGLRKMLPFNKSRNENLLISIEATQMAETSIDDIRSTESWYMNKYIRQGYTNRGQVLGAGIGPGANFQSVDISWVKGLKRLGLQFERYLHNDDFYYYAFEDSSDPRRHWTDLAVAVSGEWNYKNFIFNAKAQAIHSLNYQWYLKDGTDDIYFVNGRDANNIQLQAGFSYRF